MIVKFLTTVLLAVPAFASHRGVQSIEQFYNQVLGCPHFNLDCLQSRGLVNVVRPGVFRLNGGTIVFSDEIESSQRISKALNLPLLLIPNLPGIDGVPLSDAVVFEKNGEPLANLSIKSFRGETPNGNNNLGRQLALTRRSLFQGKYGQNYFAETFGFFFSEEGQLIARSDTPYKSIRRSLILGISRILGFTQHTERPLWLAVDFFDDRRKSFAIFQSPHNGFVYPPGRLLRVNDERIPDHPGPLKFLALDPIVRRAGNRDEISRLLVLLHDSWLSADANGVHIETTCETHVTSQAK